MYIKYNKMYYNFIRSKVIRRYYFVFISLVRILKD